MNIEFNKKAGELKVGSEVFKVGDLAIFGKVWVSSDGPCEGYVAKIHGYISKFFRGKVYSSNGGKIDFEEFSRLNGKI